MPNNNFTNALAWFNDQVQRQEADADDSNKSLIQRKQRHTMRVLGHVQEILKQSGASESLSEAVEIAALLHDIGRFHQLADTGTYDDSQGCNHAEKGAQIIKETTLLDNLSLIMRGVVLSAVKYHNRAAVPDNLGADARLALEVLRDADKLDAIRNNLKYLTPNAPHGKALKSGLVWHDSEVSPEVMELVMNRQLVPFEFIRWSNDFILFLCCWIYDMHFAYAFNHLKESGNYGALLDRLPDEAPFDEAKTQLRDDLDWIAVKA